MRSILAGAAAALLFCVAPALPAAAQTTVKPEPVTIEVPFNPPLDKVLRYRVTNSRAARPGRPAFTAEWVEELRFTKTADGFLVYWRMDWASLPAPMRSPLMAPTFKPFASDPIPLELDDSGNLLRAHDWPDTKARLLNVVEIAQKMLPPAQAAAVIPKVREMFDNLTAETAVPILLKNLAPVFGYGGIAMHVGETHSGPIEQPVELVNGTLASTLSFTLAAATPGGTATFLSRTDFDREAMQQLMAQLMARFGKLDPAAAARQKQEIAQAVDVTTETRAIVDLNTGLPTRIESSGSTSEAPGKPIRALVLTLLP